MSEPRTTRGARLHQIGNDVYAVVIDPSGKEASERHAGTAWVALSPEHGEFLFMDEHGSSSSGFIVDRRLTGVRVAVYIDGDLAHLTPITTAHVPRGTHVSVDWAEMYAAMR